MKIISWNVNGIRAVYKKGFIDQVVSWKPDILCVQETKCHPEQCEPQVLKIDGLKSYWSAAVRKGYSGTATWLREDALASFGIGQQEYDSEGRFVITSHPDFDLYNVYFPNGGSGQLRHDFKQKFLKDFLAHLKNKMDQGRELIVVGDYNVAHKEIDVWNPVRLSSVSGFLPEERAWFDEFINTGFVDLFRTLHPQAKDKYTWWDYRTFSRVSNKGWRIDYICSTKKIAERVRTAEIWDHIEGSDHCPVMIELE